MLIRPRALAVVAVLVAMAATGCAGSSSKASTLPPLSPTPTSASPSPPATGPTKAVLEQTVRRYYDELNRAAVSGDIRAADAMTSISCPCRKITQSILRYTADGGRIENARFEVHRIYEEAVEGRQGSALVVFSAPEVRAYDRSGRLVQTAPAIHDGTHSVSAVWSGRSWIITNLVSLGR